LKVLSCKHFPFFIPHSQIVVALLRLDIFFATERTDGTLHSL
jgi:hypothetical protein